MLETIAGFLAGLAAFLVIGSFWFWFLVVLASLFIIRELEYEEGYGATFTLLGTVAVVILCNGGFKSALVYAAEHAVTFLVLAVAYIVVGLVWMVVKWWFFTKNFSDQYEKARTAFLRQNNLLPDAAVPAKLKAKLVKHIKDQLSGGYGKDYDQRYKIKFNDDGLLLPLEPLDHNSTLAMWAGHWPFSALWTLLNDPVKRAYRFCIARMTGLLRAISASNFKTVQRDRLTEAELSELGPAASEDGEGTDRRGRTRGF